MASILNEIDSIFTYVEDLFPGAKIRYQEVPPVLEPNMVTLRYASGDMTTETTFHYRLDRDYQFIYFDNTELKCLDKGDALARKLNNALVIPIKGSKRYLRVGSFSLSQPFKTESGVYAIIGMLSAELREARDQEHWDKIEHVYAEIRSEIGITITKSNCHKEE
ncbi:hypothetical protein [Heyndrickxia oleronia]|uniref:Uncharacterized protein n=1 Tax=Heyndrickxia oleronia TaxID=38875 RepID=A0AAW6SSN7_9BACI|nr:hypothetical protein [Heyndrickxia oleronia]MDH5159822.1 hypothetical protein [Heyndrickxia oleronia]